MLDKVVLGWPSRKDHHLGAATLRVRGITEGQEHSSELGATLLGRGYLLVRAFLWGSGIPATETSLLGQWTSLKVKEYLD